MHVRSFAVATALLYAANSFAASADCDRQCLRDITRQYLSAMVKHTPSAAPLAPTLRYTENTIDVAAGDGLWKSATALGALQRIYVDAEQGQAGFFGLIDEQASPSPLPAIVSLRLKIVNRKIIEAEAIIGRKGVSLYEPQNLIEHGPSDKPVPKDLRSSRAAMIAAADSYFNGAQTQNPSIVLQKPGCDRYENGVKMTNRTAPSPTPNGVAADRDCAGTIANATQIAAVVNRRYPVIDEEAGVVMGTAVFNRPAGAMRRGGTPWPKLLLTEFFPIEKDRFTAIYAAMYYLPPEIADSGWKE